MERKQGWVASDKRTLERPQAPGSVPPADRSWGYCRQLTPALRSLLERKGLLRGPADHVVVLKLSQKRVMLCFWAGELAVGYVEAPASVGRDIARLGASESV